MKNATPAANLVSTTVAWKLQCLWKKNIVSYFTFCRLSHDKCQEAHQQNNQSSTPMLLNSLMKITIICILSYFPVYRLHKKCQEA